MSFGGPAVEGLRAQYVLEFREVGLAAAQRADKAIREGARQTAAEIRRGSTQVGAAARSISTSYAHTAAVARKTGAAHASAGRQVAEAAGRAAKATRDSASVQAEGWRRAERAAKQAHSGIVESQVRAQARISSSVEGVVRSLRKMGVGYEEVIRYLKNYGREAAEVAVAVERSAKREVEAIDRVTASQRRMAAMADRAKRSVGLGTARELHPVGAIAGAAGRARGALGGAAGAVVGGAAAFLSVSMVRDAAQNTAELAKQAAILHTYGGLANQTALEFAAVAQAYGVSSQRLGMTFRTLGTQVQSALVDHSKRAIQAFTELGISHKEVTAHAHDMAGMLGLVMDHMRNLPPGTEKTAVAAQLLGRSYTSLLPMLAGGSKGMNEQLDAARRLGVQLGGNSTQQAMKLHEASIQLKVAQEGLEIQFTQHLLPALLKAVEFGLKLYEVVRTNLAPVFHVLGRGVKAVSGFLREHKSILEGVKIAVAGVAAAFVGLKVISIVVRLTRGLTTDLKGFVSFAKGPFASVKAMFVEQESATSKLSAGVQQLTKHTEALAAAQRRLAGTGGTAAEAESGLATATTRADAAAAEGSATGGGFFSRARRRMPGGGGAAAAEEEAAAAEGGGGRLASLGKFGAVAGIGAGVAGAALMPQVGHLIGGHAGHTIGVLGSGAAMGAGLGMMAGPEGAAIGAGLGAVAGGVMDPKVRSGAIKGIKDLWHSLTSGGHAGKTTQKVLHDLGQAFTAIGNVATKIWKSVLGPTLRGLWAGFKTVFGGVVQVIKGFVEIISGLFSGNWKKVWKGVKDVVGGELKIVMGVLKMFWSWVSGIVKAIGLELTTGFTLAWKAVVGIFKTMVGAIGAVAKGVVHAIEWPFKMAWEGVKALFGIYKAIYVGEFHALIGAITGVWNFIIHVIPHAVSTAFGSALHFLQGLPGKFAGAVGSVAHAIVSGLGGIGSAVLGLVKGAINDGIIGPLNALIGLIDKVKIHIPKVGIGPVHIGGGTIGFNIPKIGKMQEGGWVQGPRHDHQVFAMAGGEFVATSSGQRMMEHEAPGLLSRVARAQQPHGEDPAVPAPRRAAPDFSHTGLAGGTTESYMVATAAQQVSRYGVMAMLFGTQGVQTIASRVAQVGQSLVQPQGTGQQAGVAMLGAQVLGTMPAEQAAVAPIAAAAGGAVPAAGMGVVAHPTVVTTVPHAAVGAARAPAIAAVRTAAGMAAPAGTPTAKTLPVVATQAVAAPTVDPRATGPAASAAQNLQRTWSSTAQNVTKASQEMSRGVTASSNTLAKNVASGSTQTRNALQTGWQQNNRQVTAQAASLQKNVSQTWQLMGRDLNAQSTQQQRALVATANKQQQQIVQSTRDMHRSAGLEFVAYHHDADNSMDAMRKSVAASHASITSNVDSQTKKAADLGRSHMRDYEHGVYSASNAAATVSSQGVSHIFSDLSAALKALGGSKVSPPKLAGGIGKNPMATGGRVPGAPGPDNWTLLSPGGMPAAMVSGQEILVANRHTEAAIDDKLALGSALGLWGPTSLGHEVASETRPNHMATGGIAPPRRRHPVIGRGRPMPAFDTGGYVYPLPGFTIGRTDMGIDANAAPGTPILALGDSTLVAVLQNWYAGQPLLDFRLNSGPDAGRYWYVAEEIVPVTERIGATFKAGQAVAHYAGSGTGIEIGWAGNASGATLAQTTTGYSEGQQTGPGASFRAFIGGLSHGQLVSGGPGAAFTPIKAPHVTGAGRLADADRAEMKKVTAAANAYGAAHAPTGTGGGVVSAGAGSWQAEVQKLSQMYGWNANDWFWVISHESGTPGVLGTGNPASMNSIGAFGLAQFIPSNYGSYGPGSDPRQHPTPVQEIDSMAAYIKSRYGNPTAVRAQYFSHAGGAGSYALGGRVGLQYGGLPQQASSLGWQLSGGHGRSHRGAHRVGGRGRGRQGPTERWHLDPFTDSPILTTAAQWSYIDTEWKKYKHDHPRSRASTLHLGVPRSTKVRWGYDPLTGQIETHTAGQWQQIHAREQQQHARGRGAKGRRSPTSVKQESAAVAAGTSTGLTQGFEGGYQEALDPTASGNIDFAAAITAAIAGVDQAGPGAYSGPLPPFAYSAWMFPRGRHLGRIVHGRRLIIPSDAPPRSRMALGGRVSAARGATFRHGAPRGMPHGRAGHVAPIRVRRAGRPVAGFGDWTSDPTQPYVAVGSLEEIIAEDPIQVAPYGTHQATGTARSLAMDLTAIARGGNAKKIDRAVTSLGHVLQSVGNVSYAHLQAVHDAIVRSMKRMPHGSAAARRMSNALQLVDYAMGQRVGTIVRVAEDQASALQGADTRLQRLMSSRNIDQASGQGAAMMEQLDQYTVRVLRSTVTQLQRALRLAKRSGDKSAVGDVTAKLNQALDQLDQAVSDAIVAHRTAVEAAAQDVVDRAARVSQQAATGQTTLDLQEQLAGTSGTLVGAQQVSQYIRQTIIPAIQSELGALREQQRAAQSVGDQRLADQIADSIAQRQNDLLQAQLDAQNAIKDATQTAAQDLAQLSGATGFEFQSQAFTDSLAVGVGA